MTNYSSSYSKVPYGDGHSIPISETSESEDLSDASVEKAMKDIFTSCDVENCGSVLVSKLVEFITPFMQQNMNELWEFKKTLDPNDIDPYVDSETFFKAMREWTSRLMDDPEDDQITSHTASELERIPEEDLSSMQLTQKPSFGEHFLKGLAESGFQNLSISSSNSCLGISVPDVSMLQETIKELEYQNRKLSEELAHIRLQLSSCEEQNDMLQTDVDKISRKLALEQSMHGQLESNLKDQEELLETSISAQKQVGKLEKLLASAEKENVQLKQNIQLMEAEKLKLEDHVEQLAKRECESKKLLMELQSEMNYKEQEVTSLEETNSQLQNKLSEQQQIIDHYTDVNERLKLDKLKLEQHFRDRLTRSSLSNNSKSPNSFGDNMTPNKPERTNISPMEKSHLGSSPRSVTLDSSEDEVLWKVQMMNNSSPHESLEQEIVQADTECQRNECKHVVGQLKSTVCQLEAKTAEYENTIKQLLKDINHLQVQNAKSEKQINDCEDKYEELRNKYKELEGDNSSKYIKILDLMEQTEILQKQLNTTDDRFMELNVLKDKIVELQQEKQNLEGQLKQLQRQDVKSLLQQLQSVKTEYKLLKGTLEVSTKTEQKLSKEFEKICCENCELRNKIEFLDETIRNLTIEKNRLHNSIQKLSEEYNALKGDFKHKNDRETEISEKLTKLLNENIELKEKLSKENPEKTETQVQHVETLKKVVREHTLTIEKLFQTIEEKKRQIAMLKKIINYQNTNIKSLESSKLKNTDQIYEQKCVNDKLVEQNKELLEKLNQFEKEKIRLQSQLLCLGENSKCIQAELENVRCDNKKMKDAHNILKENQLLTEDKDLLVKQKEDIVKDSNRLKEINSELEQTLHHLQQDKTGLSSTVGKLKAELSASETKANKLTETLHKLQEKENQLTNDFKDESVRLENSRQLLISENKYLKEKLEEIELDYKTLIKEKEQWAIEKNKWYQMNDDLTNSLADARLEISELCEKLNAYETEDNECKQCIILESDIANLNAYIEELTRKVNTLEAEVERQTKKGNFEKMQLIIEKLKSQVEEDEGLLKKEKQKVELSEKTNSKLLEQINYNLKHHDQEKDILSKEKLEVERQVYELSEELRQVKIQNHDLEQEKDQLYKNNCNIEKQSRKTGEENIQLQNEITDLHNRQISLEKKILKLQRDLKLKVSLETKAEETIKKKDENLEILTKTNEELQQEIGDLRKLKADLDKQTAKLQDKLKDKITIIEKYETEMKTKVDLLESVNKECVQLQQEKDSINNEKYNLEKKLERTQHDLQKSEAKNLSIRKLLTNMRASVYDDNDDDALQENVEALLKEKDSQVNVLQQQLKTFEDELSEIKVKLSESTSSLHSLSEHVEIANKKLSEKRQRLSRSILTLVDNWRMVLENRSDMRTVLEALNENEVGSEALDFSGPLDEELCKLRHQIHHITLFFEALSTMKPSPTSEENVSPSPSNQRFIKKVTLKTTTTEVRSIDPNNPLAEGITEINSEMGDDVNRPSQNPNHMEGTLLKMENEQFVQNSLLDISSPSFSDAALESMNLTDKDSSPILNESQLENSFGLLVAAFMIDISTIKDRYKQQQIRQNDMENRFSMETEKLVTALKIIMQELDKEHHLKSHIQKCLGLVEVIMQTFAQTSISAMQYGALHHEHRLIKCINLMINHAAHLKRILESTSQQLKSISYRCKKDSPKHEKSFDTSFTTHCTDNMDTVALLTSQERCTSNNVTNTVAVAQDGDVFDEHQGSLSKVRHNISNMKNYLGFRQYFWLIIIFLSSICVLLVSVTQMSSSEPSMVYPWQWVSWNDIFAPYVKKSYPNGPPPI